MEANVRRSAVHAKRKGVVVAAPPPDPSPNVVSIGATVRVSNLRPAIALVGGNTLRRTTASNTAAKIVLGQSVMDMFIHANAFGTLSNLWPNQSDDPSVWQWGQLDGRVQTGVDLGLRVYMMIGNPARWAIGGADPTTKFWPNANATDANFFATTVATRYNTGNKVYGYHLQNEWKGLNGVTPWRYVDFTNIYNGMRAAVKAVNTNIKVGGPYTPSPQVNSGDGYVSDPTSSRYVAAADPGWVVNTRALDAFDYWFANADGYDFISCDGINRVHTNLFNWYVAQHGINPATNTLPVHWAEFYAGVQNDPYYSATPTLTEKRLRLIHNIINGAYAGVSAHAVWGGDYDLSNNSQSATPPYPENEFWLASDGSATDTANWMKMLKDNFSEGVTLKTFVSNNPGIVGICSATKLMILNKTNASQVTDTPGGTITLDPQSVVLQ